MREMSQRSSNLIVGLFAAAALVFGGLAAIPGQFTQNLASLDIVHTLTSQSTGEAASRLAVEAYTKRSCQRYWLLGLVAQRYDNRAEMIEEWECALRCDGGYMAAIRMNQPQNQTLAVLATTAYPDLAESGSGWHNFKNAPPLSKLLFR